MSAPSESPNCFYQLLYNYIYNVSMCPWVLLSRLTFLTGSAAESWTALPLQRRHSAVHHFVRRSDHGPVAGKHTQNLKPSHTHTDNSCLCVHCDCDSQLLSLVCDPGALWSKIKGKFLSQIQCEMLLCVFYSVTLYFLVLTGVIWFLEAFAGLPHLRFLFPSLPRMPFVHPEGQVWTCGMKLFRWSLLGTQHAVQLCCIWIHCEWF